MTEAFMVRFEFSSIRSRGIEGPHMVQVRQQAWTEKLCIVSTCILYFGDFCISRPSFQKGLLSKHRYYWLDIKDQYLI